MLLGMASAFLLLFLLLPEIAANRNSSRHTANHQLFRNWKRSGGKKIRCFTNAALHWFFRAPRHEMAKFRPDPANVERDNNPVERATGPNQINPPEHRTASPSTH